MDINENWVELVLGRAGNPNFSRTHADNNKPTDKNKAKCIEVHLFQLKISSPMQVLSNLVCIMQVESYWSRYLCRIYPSSTISPQKADTMVCFLPFISLPCQECSRKQSVFSHYLWKGHDSFTSKNTSDGLQMPMGMWLLLSAILGNTSNEHRHLIPLPPAYN